MLFRCSQQKLTFFSFAQNVTSGDNHVWELFSIRMFLWHNTMNTFWQKMLPPFFRQFSMLFSFHHVEPYLWPTGLTPSTLRSYHCFSVLLFYSPDWKVYWLVTSGKRSTLSALSRKSTNVNLGQLHLISFILLPSPLSCFSHENLFVQLKDSGQHSVCNECWVVRC